MEENQLKNLKSQDSKLSFVDNKRATQNTWTDSEETCHPPSNLKDKLLINNLTIWKSCGRKTNKQFREHLKIVKIWSLNTTSPQWEHSRIILPIEIKITRHLLFQEQKYAGKLLWVKVTMPQWCPNRFVAIIWAMRWEFASFAKSCDLFTSN
jgi:hypothetical protein